MGALCALLIVQADELLFNLCKGHEVLVLLIDSQIFELLTLLQLIVGFKNLLQLIFQHARYV